MSVGTNENVKNVNEKIKKIDNLNEVKEFENIEVAGKNEGKVIDMEATQRIVILGDFIQKESQKFNNEISAPLCENEEIQNSSSEKSDAQIDFNSNSKNSEENVQTTPNEVLNEENDINSIEENLKDEIESIQENHINDNNFTNAQNTITIENNEVNDLVDNSDNTEATQTFINEENKIEEEKNINAEETSTQNINNIENNIKNNQDSEIELEKKKKQHAQDKKDYRLEKLLFDRINTMQGKIKESLELIKKFERINAKEENLPNIVTTLHDKLTHEVIKQFRTVGIEFNMKSYLVQSVVSDLLARFEEGITEFKDCSENLNFVREVQDDFESRVELAPTSKVKNFFARIRGMFKPERKQEKLEEFERERQEKKLQEANIHLIKYKFINSELEKYTIKNNIVESLSREILYGQSSGLTNNINEFIDDKISAEMKKLGLEASIPELKKDVFNKYKEKDETISIEDFEQIPLGTLKKNMKLSNFEIARSKITRVVNYNKVKEEDEEEISAVI